MLERPPYHYLRDLCLGPFAQLAVVDTAPGRQTHGEEVAARRRSDHVLSPVLALGRGQALAELGCAGVYELVIGRDTEIQGPAFGGAYAPDGIGAHHAPAWLSAVPIEDVLVEPDVQRAEIAAERAKRQRNGLRVGCLGNTGHSQVTRSTIGDLRLVAQFEALRLARAGLGQLGDELHPARALVFGQSRA